MTALTDLLSLIPRMMTGNMGEGIVRAGLLAGGWDRKDVAADDQLYDQVVAAVGLTGGHLPTHWLPPAASIHVGKWRSQLGLTATEIIATARESRKRHDDPPRGPKALDRAMEATASAKSTSFSASGGARPRSPAQGQRKPHWQVMAERDEREQARRHA